MKLILFVMMTLGAFAQAATKITISGTAPAGTTIEAHNTYISNSNSWFCSHLKLNESLNFERIADMYFYKETTKVTSGSFSLSYDTALDKCDATLQGSELQIIAPGYDDNNSWVYVTSGQNNVSEVQHVDCQKMVYNGRVDNACSGNLIVGPDGKLNLAITIGNNSN